MNSLSTRLSNKSKYPNLIFNIIHDEMIYTILEMIYFGSKNYMMKSLLVSSLALSIIHFHIFKVILPKMIDIMH